MLILLAGGDAAAALREGATPSGPDPAEPDPAPSGRTEPGPPPLDRTPGHQPAVPEDELEAEWRLWCGGQEDEGRPAGGRPALQAF